MGPTTYRVEAIYRAEAIAMFHATLPSQVVADLALLAALATLAPNTRRLGPAPSHWDIRRVSFKRE